MSNSKDQTWTSIGGDLEASYDGNKYLDIRVKPSHHITEDNITLPDSIRIYMSEEVLQKALTLFPNKGFNLGDIVIYTIPAYPDCNQSEIKFKALIIGVHKTITEKLIINRKTNKQEKQYTEERSYNIQPDDDDFIHTNCPERRLKLIL